MQPQQKPSEAPRHEQPASSEAAASAGWDPYEVWRTRILLPRQRQQAAETPEAQAPVAELQVRLVHASPMRVVETLEPRAKR